MPRTPRHKTAPPAAAAPTPAIAPTTKTALVLLLLGEDDGASLEALTTATGWLPHTVRAALSGLRKKGHAIVHGDGRYRLEQG